MDATLPGNEHATSRVLFFRRNMQWEHVLKSAAVTVGLRPSEPVILVESANRSRIDSVTALCLAALEHPPREVLVSRSEVQQTPARSTPTPPRLLNTSSSKSAASMTSSDWSPSSRTFATLDLKPPSISAHTAEALSGLQMLSKVALQPTDTASFSLGAGLLLRREPTTSVPMSIDLQEEQPSPVSMERYQLQQLSAQSPTVQSSTKVPARAFARARRRYVGPERFDNDSNSVAPTLSNPDFHDMDGFDAAADRRDANDSSSADDSDSSFKPYTRRKRARSIQHAVMGRRIHKREYEHLEDDDDDDSDDSISEDTNEVDSDNSSVITDSDVDVESPLFRPEKASKKPLPTGQVRLLRMWVMTRNDIDRLALNYVPRICSSSPGLWHKHRQGNAPTLRRWKMTPAPAVLPASLSERSPPVSSPFAIAQRCVSSPPRIRGPTAVKRAKTWRRRPSRYLAPVFMELYTVAQKIDRFKSGFTYHSVILEQEERLLAGHEDFIRAQLADPTDTSVRHSALTLREAVKEAIIYKHMFAQSFPDSSREIGVRFAVPMLEHWKAKPQTRPQWITDSFDFDEAIQRQHQWPSSTTLAHLYF
ncbi:hypothetical protein CAOG_06076 [Capsaspora owczarzaki ATCC 30864]|nr:hypothetical protein CAOG_06076 [Capsaspora owczarzaki ATCC 30864]|eukprot:XP_004345666.1 hypothetical protein CAOG_06076 [Capsaspora owczarzaki ATCC 30864]